MHTLDIKNVNVETGGKRTAEGINLTIRSGEIHVLMGPNGSGKSSLLNGLFGHPNHILNGKITLDGDDISFLSTDKKAKSGLFLSMQQIPEIYGVTMINFLYRAYKELNGAENVSIIDFNKKVGDCAEGFGISKEILKRQVNFGFSGGEKKLGEILQLLALKPKIAFLDEIDSGVDVDSLNKVFTVIRALKNEGIGFLLVTHYPDILKKITPDFVHVMKGGKIIKSGGQEIISEIEKNGFGG